MAISRSLAPELAYKAALDEQETIQNEWIERRLKLVWDCEQDEKIKAAVLKHCENDPLFFFDYFAWTDDPRGLSDEQIMPLIRYEFQTQLILWLKENIESTMGTAERRNLLIEKTRDMGVSWVVCVFLLWWWRFRNGKFIFLSRKEQEVDVRDDLDTPFEKMRWSLRRWPDWLLPPKFDWKYHDKNMLLKNPSGGQIVGESANKSASRGGRCLMAVFDEHPVMGNDEAAWRSAAGSTRVRLSIGTPAGPTGKYYRLATGKDKERVEKMRLHWVLHPLKAAGLEYDENGNPTSPWYRNEVEGLSAEEIAGELNIDYNASVKGIVYHDYKEPHKYGKLWNRPNLIPIAGCHLLWILDPGLTFAALMMQRDKYNRLLCFREIVMTNALIRDVADEIQVVTADFKNKYGDFVVDYAGDPAGGTRAGAGADQAEYDILRNEYDMDVDSTFMSETPARLRIPNRIEAVHGRLGKWVMQLQNPTPSLLVDVDFCPVLDEAMSGHYRYKTNKDREYTQNKDVEHRQPWCDIADCVGYGAYYYMGLGTGGHTDRNNIEIEQDGYTWGGQRKRY